MSGPGWQPPFPYAPPVWSPPAEESPNAALARQLIAKAQYEEVEKSQELDLWGNGQIYSGLLTMGIAVLWFFGGLLLGVIFCYAPVLFIIGMIALINGIIQKARR